MRRILLCAAWLLFAAGRVDAGWGPVEQVTFDVGYSGLTGSNGTALSVDADGRVHVVWHDDRNGQTEVYHAVREPLGGWSPTATRVSHGAVEARNASIVISPEGTPHVFWEDRRDGKWAIYHSRLDPVSGWAEVDEEISDSAADASKPSAAMDAAGRLFLVWQDAGDGGFRIRYRVLDPDGSVTEPVFLTSAEVGAWGPFIARGLADDMHLVWHETRLSGWKVRYKSYRGAAGWDTTSEMITDFPSTSWDARLVVDPAGLRHVFWSDDRADNFEIYYKKRYPGHPWGDDKEFTSAENTSGGPRAAVDAAGNIHVLWEDFRSGLSAVYYKKIAAATGWDAHDTGLTDGLSTAWDPSLALDAQGNAHVVWSGNATGNFEIYYRYGSGLVPTAILLRSLEATPSGAAVRLAWELEEEPVGLNIVRRSEGEDSDRWIGAPLPGGLRRGQWTDGDVVPGTRYEYRLAVTERDGTVTVHGPVRATAPLPEPAWVSPNPFRALVTITVACGEAGPARADVWDARGRRVARLDARRSGASLVAVWDGRDEHGRGVPAGRYWVRMGAGAASVTVPVVRAPG